MAYRDDQGRKPGRYGNEGQGERRRGNGNDKRGAGSRYSADDKRGAGARYGADDKRGVDTRYGTDDKRGAGSRYGADDKRGAGDRYTPRKAGPPRVDGRPAPRGPRGDDRFAPRPQRVDQRPPRIAPPPPPVPMLEEGEASLPRENLLPGRNPIREAIRSGRDIERLLVARGELSGSAREIVAMAREGGIVIQTVDRTRLDELAPSHQGMIAIASAYRYSTVEDMFALAKERGEDPLLVVLDGITDPHNLGAIIRSAECAGAHGVIVPDRRAVGLTPAAVKASAGAVAYLPVARVGNLSRFLDTLKAQGVWVTAADMDGELYTQADLTGPMALVIGAEGSGVSRLVLEHADRHVALPMQGKIDSLNASVAAGVMLYEIRRQRG